MIISNIEKSKFIIEFLKDNTLDVKKLKQIPMLIRTNGLILSLEYLNDKEKDISNVFSDYLSQNYDTQINSTNIIKRIGELNSEEYMILQKDMYEFSIILKNLSIATQKEKGVVENEWW